MFVPIVWLDKNLFKNHQLTKKCVFKRNCHRGFLVNKNRAVVTFEKPLSHLINVASIVHSPVDNFKVDLSQRKVIPGRGLRSIFGQAFVPGTIELTWPNPVYGWRSILLTRSRLSSRLRYKRGGKSCWSWYVVESTYSIGL